MVGNINSRLLSIVVSDEEVADYSIGCEPAVFGDAEHGAFGYEVAAFEPSGGSCKYASAVFFGQ